MRAARYRHSCIIRESLGFDKTTGLEQWAEIYNGVCLYQEMDDVSISSGIAQSSPYLYLPENNSIFARGMECVVTCTKGVQIISHIENFIDYQGEKINGTRIMLKQSIDV